ncbi:hypothetical protein TREMEDRAFT_25255 [Tremella mesenterica DSM 1558]|uniref:uncharacterized protein n=1 Tax=Tremella mesenterica (strain ATCC 24925 / CBS 8224 / DSM 1558 / NBRC 9311 / NRRL Y-6157 / RJB 2259-6 / UBC 559-6) TaxID=578456 RepID=UPI0003F4A3D7|nr:uncharacterized protein TREMEDRAFT_25255 [Tremella mesenterica DSM 1558]EIW72011.1 hypothetical protein TREMEDRAFT_25255 [Tremella mesenterica DSM 1558]
MSRLPLVRLLPHAGVYRYGTPTTSPSAAILRLADKGWTISQAPKEGWAVVGDTDGRKLAVETLLSRHRISPNPPPGAFPYLTETSQTIRHLAFARPPPSGEFIDFTARYGALQEEDRLTFRDQLKKYGSSKEIENVSKTLGISHLLDLPGVSLSSGQTRRARIASALLTKPGLLLLEDPMAGLDVSSREEVSKVLGDLNERMRIVLVLKDKEGGMPDWVSDVVEVKNGNVWIGKREEWEERRSVKHESKVEEIQEKVVELKDERVELDKRKEEGETIVKLENVSVSYGQGSRPVLKNISWEIKKGEKWHLQGPNGSGKTTLLSIILGHHPLSFSIPSTSLILFSKPRRSIPTPILKTMIGHTSPEIYSSFPRGMGLTALEVIGTGFEGIFSRRNLSFKQKKRILDLLQGFQDLLGDKKEELGDKLFTRFTNPQQSLLLLLRAIVGKPDLIILDEPAQGMDEVLWERCCELLFQEWKENEQSVIVVSHYEDEVPWKKGRGRVIRLDQGEAIIE